VHLQHIRQEVGCRLDLELHDTEELTETAKSLILLKKQLLKLCLRRRRRAGDDDDGLLRGLLEVKS
jgi:hypothetical protein